MVFRVAINGGDFCMKDDGVEHVDFMLSEG